MEQSVVQMVTQITIAVGTVGVCILAIWGNRIRSCIAGPRLEFRLHNPRGDLTWRRNGTSAIYHHLKIENKRDWSPARHVRIFCTSIQKKAPDGSFVEEPLAFPVQLDWPFRKLHETPPIIGGDEICNLGFLDENSDVFRLSLYVYPNNFRGFIKANEAMRVSLIAKADNFTSKTPYVVEVWWDGKWDADLEEMQKHLVVKEI